MLPRQDRRKRLCENDEERKLARMAAESDQHAAYVAPIILAAKATHQRNLRTLHVICA